MIILDKLTGSENDQSWADSVDLWFVGAKTQRTFTTTQSMRFEITSNTFVMVSQFHSRSDSQRWTR